MVTETTSPLNFSEILHASLDSFIQITLATSDVISGFVQYNYQYVILTKHIKISPNKRYKGKLHQPHINPLDF